MTIQSATARVSFACNSVSTIFPVPIQAYLPTDFLVIATNAGLGTETTLTLNSDYTLAPSGTLSPTAWTLTTQTGQLASPYATGYTLQVILNPTQTQITQYVQGQAFPSLAVQTNIDRLTQMIIRQQDLESRSIQAPDGDVNPLMILPPAASRANLAPLFDANGNLVMGIIPTTVLTQSIFNAFLSAAPPPQLFFPQTPAELVAGIIPVSFAYPTLPFADVRRYGCICDGLTDDTAALQKAFTVASTLGLALVLPYGYSLKISSYVSVFSNTTFHILGQLLVSNRSAGLSIAGQNNVSIYGHKIGLIQDPAVLGAYAFDSFTVLHPSIHIRANNAGTVPSTNCLVDGVNFAYVQQGVFLSSVTVDFANAASWPFTTQAALNCRVHNCNMQFCEASGISSLVSQDSGYRDNYVYRCGDGGLWMMGCTNNEVVGNHRVSPIATPSAVNYGAGPFNVLATAATWNDEQGMEFQSCYNLLIQGNTVENFWSEGIDIKDSCQRVLCTENRVNNCENASIIVRAGDPGNQAPNFKITISDNIISGHGTLQFNLATPEQGAIFHGDSYICEIKDNVIYSYQNTPGINCLGPGANQSSTFPGNPHQASVTITGNCFDFKSNFQENDASDIPFFGNPPGWTSTTAFSSGATVKPTASNGFYFVAGNSGTTGGSQPSWPTSVNATILDGNITWMCQTTKEAILVNGEYDSVLINDNHIRTDRFLSADARFNLSSAIQLTYIKDATTLAFYPSGASIEGNNIQGWGFNGITVAGLDAVTYSNLNVSNNVVTAAAGTGILLTSCHYCNVNGNAVSQPGAQAGSPAINVSGVSGHPLNGGNVTGNSATGGWSVGSNSMTFGLLFSFFNRLNASNNVVQGAATSNIGSGTPTGDLILNGTTGFPRSGAGSPNGAITSFYTGEMYFDTGGHWWAASTFNSSVWTQLS